MTKYAVRRDRFLEICGRIGNLKILVVGDVGIDRYTIGTAERLSPEAPVPIVAVQSVKDKLGMAANVADNIKTFGAHPMLASLIGEDRAGDEFRRLLKNSEISTDLIFARTDRRTSLKERVIALPQPQQVVRIDHESTESLSTEEENFLWGKLESKIQNFDAIILEDYAKGLVTENIARNLIKKAQDEKKFLSVDPPSPRYSPKIYHGCSLITPNLQEAEKLSGIKIRDEQTLQKAGAYLLETLQAKIVVITRGKLGMTIFTAKSAPLHVPTFARAVYDVSGAGDTVISMVTVALVAGATLEEAALLANYAAGVVVGKQGTATVTIDELQQYMQLCDALV